MADPGSPATDGEIIERVRAGQRHEFSQLVRKYQSSLIRAAESRLGCREAAEDMVQETFLCALRFLHTYDPQYSFRTWLWTILLNQCRRSYRQTQRRREVPAASDANVGEVVSDEAQYPPSLLLAHERREQLHQLLAELPAPQADALRMRFFGGLKFQEIADAMGSSLSAAKRRVRHGLIRLSAVMDNEQAGEAAVDQQRGDLQ